MFHKSKKAPSQGRYGGGRASESYGGRGGSSSREGTEGRERFVRKKVCRFCTERIYSVDYKETEKLQKFLTEKGKILPQRISGNCTKHQRILSRAIKRARHASMVPFQMT